MDGYRSGVKRTWAGGPEWFTKWFDAVFGGRLSRAIAMPQPRRRNFGDIPWVPLRRPPRQATVALVSTAGVHLSKDAPFNIRGDGTFRVIPRDAQAGDITLTHPAYDRRDAQRDLNLVFPLERLRELEAEGVIGRLAQHHYGFGLSPNDTALNGPGKEMARRLQDEGVDLALLVPA
jgi:D-proline reductase (dithiol) PrdB